jgi:hypothetical protein
MEISNELCDFFEVPHGTKMTMKEASSRMMNYAVEALQRADDPRDEDLLNRSNNGDCFIADEKVRKLFKIDDENGVIKINMDPTDFNPLHSKLKMHFPEGVPISLGKLSPPDPIDDLPLTISDELCDFFKVTRGSQISMNGASARMTKYIQENLTKNTAIDFGDYFIPNDELRKLFKIEDIKEVIQVNLVPSSWNPLKVHLRRHFPKIYMRREARFTWSGPGMEIELPPAPAPQAAPKPTLSAAGPPTPLEWFSIVEPMAVSDELCDFFEIDHGSKMSMTEATVCIAKQIWDYNLLKAVQSMQQHSAKSEEKAKFITFPITAIPDEKIQKIRKLFGMEEMETSELSYISIQNFLRRHFLDLTTNPPTPLGVDSAVERAMKQNDKLLRITKARFSDNDEHSEVYEVENSIEICEIDHDAVKLFMESMNPISNELCDFIGVAHGTKICRNQIAVHICDYISENHLDILNDNDYFLLDEKLKSLFSVSESTEKMMYMAIQSHLDRHCSVGSI